ncbi:hypothetical protein MASR1M8_09310 [Thermomonas brevis]
MKAMPIAVLLGVALAACASTRPSSADTLAAYLAHAGQPVSQFHYFGRAMGWERVDDAHVLLNLRPRESWLLRVSGSCLDWGSASPKLGLSSRNGVVAARFDQVLVEGAPMGCRIEEIRRVDMQAVRAARRAPPAQASGT